tara:strand:- start:22234 stop:24060 length:1827 start_codon:yes stop_codon:yes gene_type:complete
MVVSYYIIKYPYKLVWNILNFFKKRKEVVFYCANELDLEIFKNVKKHLKPISVVVRNKRIKNKLKTLGVKSRLMPVFPKAVIMCRQACYLFPESKIIRIGINHGAYHFKPFANVKGHNMFNQFFFSSAQEVKEAEQIGITSGVGVGFPKLDDAFNGTYDSTYLNNLKCKLNLNPNKKTILFSATWDGSDMSAVHLWYDKLNEFTSDYNVLVTVHIWTSDKYKNTIKRTSGISFIDTQNITPYIIISDICICDTSSIISEMCALNKPIVTFRVPVVKRTVPEVREIIKDISFQIEDFSELADGIEFSYKNSYQKQNQREIANKRMFEKLDGKSGERVASKITELLPELKMDSNKINYNQRNLINQEFSRLNSFLQNLPERFEKEGKCLYKGRNEIRIFEHEGFKLNVKSFKIPHFINKVAYGYLRGSKAKHSFEFAMKIRSCGSETPEPVACIEILKAGLFNRSYYVSLHHEYDFTIRDLISFDFPDKENILKQFAVFTYEKLHKHNIHHLDYSRGNILITRLENHKYDFSIVDINRMRFEKMDFIKGLKNFSQIWANEEELTIVGKEYARINNKSEDEAARLLIQFDKEHKKKIERKKRFKKLFKSSK